MSEEERWYRNGWDTRMEGNLEPRPSNFLSTDTAEYSAYVAGYLDCAYDNTHVFNELCKQQEMF